MKKDTTKKHSTIGKFKTVFSGTLFEIRQAEVILPSGHRGTFERAFKTPSVTVMLIGFQIKESTMQQLVLFADKWFQMVVSWLIGVTLTP